MRDEHESFSDPPQDDDIHRLAGIIERLIDNSGYREAPQDNGLKSIVIGCTITILSAGIIGALVFVNEFSAFRGQVSEWQKSTDRRLEQLEHRP